MASLRMHLSKEIIKFNDKDGRWPLRKQYMFSMYSVKLSLFLYIKMHGLRKKVIYLKGFYHIKIELYMN